MSKFAVVVGDRTYPSVVEAAEEHGMNPSTVRIRIVRGWDIGGKPAYYAHEGGPRKCRRQAYPSTQKAVVWGDMRFANAKEASEFFGIKYTTMYYAIKKKREIEGSVIHYEGE